MSILHNQGDHAQHCRVMRIKKQVELRILTINCHSILAEIVGSDAEEIDLFRKIITDDCCCRSLNHNSLFRIAKLYALSGKLRLKKKGETIPFDVNTVRTFEYDLTDLDNVEETKKRLEQTIGTFSFENKTNALGQDEENNKQLFFQSILTMLYQIQDSITELKEQINKKDTETIQAIMQTSLNNAQKEESTDVVMMKTLLPELIKNPKLFQNLMQFAEMTNKPKKQ